MRKQVSHSMFGKTPELVQQNGNSRQLRVNDETISTEKIIQNLTEHIRKMRRSFETEWPWRPATD